jgi:hypothetical protein
MWPRLCSHSSRLSKSASRRFNWRGAGLVVTLLETVVERLLSSAQTDDERLAIERAMLAASIGAMESVDDSLDELGQHFRDHEHAYLELLRGVAERPGLLRDLLELSICEDYGLFHELEPFLCTFTEPQADLALRELATIIAELRVSGLDYQLEKARRLSRWTTKTSPFASLCGCCQRSAVGAFGSSSCPTRISTTSR